MEKSDGKTIRVPIATQGNIVESTWMTWESSAFESVTVTTAALFFHYRVDRNIH